MSKSPAFSLYPKDFYLDTAHLTAEEVGVYVRLLMRQWVEPLKENREDLARIAGLSATRFSRVWARLSVHFSPSVVPGCVANPRLEDERAKQLARRVERAASGKTGADVRWHRDSSAINRPLATDGFAVAVASAVATPLLPAWLDEIPDAKHRETVAGVLRSTRNPDARASTIESLHTIDGYSWPVIGQALVELLANGGTYNAAYHRACCRRLKAGDPPPRERSGPRLTQREKNLAVLDAELAKCDAEEAA